MRVGSQHATRQPLPDDVGALSKSRALLYRQPQE